MRRRTDYDHEPAYRRIRDAAGTGWDDLGPTPATDSYDALRAFLASTLCPDPARFPRAIDLGCGGGQAALLLASAGFQTTGVDFAPTAIELARANAARAGAVINFQTADCLCLTGEQDKTYGLAIDNHCLHCLTAPADRARFLREACRVLRPGAVLFSETMSAEGGPDFGALNVDPRTRVDGRRTRFWVTETELRTEFANAGFRILELHRRPQPDRPNPGDTLVVIARRPDPSTPDPAR